MGCCKSLVYLVGLVTAATPAYAAWTWTTLDYPGASSTEARGIDGQSIVGEYRDPSNRSHGFLYDGASWTTLDLPGMFSTFVHGIAAGRVVGSCTAIDGGFVQGFVYDAAGYTTLMYPGSQNTTALGVSGDHVVGYYTTPSDSMSHGFLYDGMTYANLDYPGATVTFPCGISAGRVVGWASGSDGTYGFTYDGAVWSRLDFPGTTSIGTSLHGIDGGSVVGAYVQSNAQHHGVSHHAVFYDGTTWTPLVPLTTFPQSRATGVSDSRIVGFYEDDGHRTHGFLVSLPEPATLMLISLVWLGAARERKQRGPLGR